ncbi:choice-of-anchor J domain-containing protein [Weeksellaceae bacterium KMM 9713]|uniref:Choice-of-anchor J domain-containing protein n=1 Tax=Profundicola chukchiensis TaxID=2961959 RepID=A0A9X4N002_9FLAO|nr:GEVED domain-containing protein [Profundicola chukchiensis]MDG4946100.1 choice-of-anchor J domain-containing protein [Profundicola chukchiensis]
MKKFLLLAGALFLANVNGQVFQENWDGDGPGVAEWIFIDNDGNTPAEQVSDFLTAWVIKDRGGEAPNYGGPDGDFAAASTSWYDPAGQSDDWMISPEISIPATGDISVKWDAKAQDPDYPDGYSLMVSPTAGTTIADFTETLFSIAQENGEWTTRVSSLADYAGQTIRLAWVNNSTDMFVLLVDNISVEELSGETPDCPSLISPANEATDVDASDVVSFTWEAPTTGGDVENYTFFIGTSMDDMINIGNTTETTISLTGVQNDTTYYWYVVANNLFGTSVECETFSFTTLPSAFSPYCGPVQITSTVEAITYVGFAGIDNSSAVDSEIGHENFIDQVGTVEPGETYQITLKGYTSGPYTNRFAVFIDWNQDGTFSADETYQVTEEIYNSTGLDDIQAVHDIMVPADAMLGETRMRVKKIFGTTGLLDPCAPATWGQVEDYTISVSTLGTNDLTLSKFSVYPNPTSKELNIKGTDVKNVKVYNVLGQQMKVFKSNNSVNVENLAPGTYVLQVEDMQGQVKTTKFIKK